jgi:hypothetical protein
VDGRERLLPVFKPIREGSCPMSMSAPAPSVLAFLQMRLSAEPILIIFH